MNERVASRDIGAAATLPVGSRPQLDIRVETRGSRSFVAGQFVTYPFHLTRAFQLDPGLPQVATLYMQSSSGGLYAGENLGIRVEVGRGAALHLTTQGSTIVQGHEGRVARTRIRLNVEAGGFLAFTPDPQILFPGASCRTDMEIRLGEGAALVLSDGFLTHDPTGASRPPALYRASVSVFDAGGVPIFTDRQLVSGAALADAAAPLAGHRVAGSALAFGLPDDPNRLADWERRLAAAGTLAGATPLSGGGIGARILAKAGSAFQEASWQICAAAFEARFGSAPARRRK